MKCSWTSRSKIWEPAGDTRRGLEADRARPGDDGVIKGWSSWAGEAADGLVEDMLGALVGTDWGEAGFFDDKGAAVFSSVFFLPKPKSPRFLAFWPAFVLDSVALLWSSSALILGIDIVAAAPLLGGADKSGRAADFWVEGA
jgi:hypothetical protein